MLNWELLKNVMVYFRSENFIPGRESGEVAGIPEFGENETYHTKNQNIFSIPKG
jgi:hypothetical protein